MTYEGFWPFFERMGASIFRMLGESTDEELSVTFAHGVLFGPISTFWKCSDRFGLNSQLRRDVRGIPAIFRTNEHFYIWNAWIVGVRRIERNFCKRRPFSAHKYFFEM